MPEIGRDAGGAEARWRGGRAASLEWRAMHPFLRNAVIGVVGLIIAGALAALALITRDPEQSVLSLLGAGILASVIGIFLFVQGWIWSVRAWRMRQSGQSIAFALAGGLMIVVAGAALAGTLILLLLFVLG